MGSLNENFYEKDLPDENTPSSSAARTSLRIQYEAQVAVIRRQIGSLESAREKLGLSQRKMAQLLLVDPSAWSRWTKSGEDAPAHIYRALQWYLALQEKIPGLTAQYFIGKDPEVLHQTAMKHLRAEKEMRSEEMTSLAREMNQKMMDLQKDLSEQRRWNRHLLIFLTGALLSLCLFLLWRH